MGLLTYIAKTVGMHYFYKLFSSSEHNTKRHAVKAASIPATWAGATVFIIMELDKYGVLSHFFRWLLK